jgi:hypothetical protein
VHRLRPSVDEVPDLVFVGSHRRRTPRRLAVKIGRLSAQRVIAGAVILVRDRRRAGGLLRQDSDPAGPEPSSTRRTPHRVEALLWRSAPCKLRGSRPAHVVYPAEALPEPNARSRDVELPPIHAMSCQRRECVMRVVPGLTERQESQRCKVLGSVARSKRTTSKSVTDGVDAPGDMVHEEDADQAAPDERCHRRRQGARERPTRQERDGEAAHGPQRKQSRDDAEVSILKEVGRESLLIGGLRSK